MPGWWAAMGHASPVPVQEAFQFLSDRFHVAAWSTEDTQQLHQQVLLVAQAWCCPVQAPCFMHSRICRDGGHCSEFWPGWQRMSMHVWPAQPFLHALSDLSSGIKFVTGRSLGL